MILIFIFQLLIKTTIIRDANHYAAGVLVCLRDGLDIGTLSQNDIIKMGVELCKGNLLPLVEPRLCCPIFLNIYKSKALNEMTDVDEELKSRFDEYDGMYILNKVKPLLKLLEIIKSNFENRFGPGAPLDNHSRQFVSQAKFRKSVMGGEDYENIFSAYPSSEADFFTYDELALIHRNNCERITKLSLLYALKMCKIPSGYPYSDMACTTNENSG